MKSEHGKSGKVLLLRKLQEKYILTLKKASSGQKYFILTTLTVSDRSPQLKKLDVGVLKDVIMWLMMVI